jgi:hypothetical protein
MHQTNYACFAPALTYSLPIDIKVLEINMYVGVN